MPFFKKRNILKVFINLSVHLTYFLNVHSVFLECPMFNMTFHKCFIFSYQSDDNMCYQYCKHLFQHDFERRFENVHKV